LADASTWADEHNGELRGSGARQHANLSIDENGYHPREPRSSPCTRRQI
jgi:hypothetical protein